MPVELRRQIDVPAEGYRAADSPAMAASERPEIRISIRERRVPREKLDPGQVLNR
jgi:hypothetical protein